jgi:hypothetical protein
LVARFGRGYMADVYSPFTPLNPRVELVGVKPPMSPNSKHTRVTEATRLRPTLDGPYMNAQQFGYFGGRHHAPVAHWLVPYLVVVHPL